MDPISKQYTIGKSFQLCSISELEFAPRDGYQFRYWIDNNGNTYDDGESITLTESMFSISAVWKLSSETLPIGEINKSKICEYNESCDIWWMNS